MKRGRPSLYTPETAQAICDRVMLGESLERMGGTEGLPSANTLWRWLAQHREFREMYTRAKEFAADVLLEEIIKIADAEGVDAPDVGHLKLKVDTRKWAMAKLAPKKYGDNARLDVEVKHSLADMLVQLNQRRQGEDEPRLIGEGTGDE